MTNRYIPGTTGITDQGKTKASDAIKEAMQKNGGAKAVGGSRHGKPDYKDAMKKRIEEYKNEMIKEASNRSSVTLPGVDPDDMPELSAGAKAVLEQMAQKKAKKEAKKKRIKEKIMAKEAKNKKKGPINWIGQAVGWGRDPDEEPAASGWGHKEEKSTFGSGFGHDDEDDRRHGGWGDGGWGQPDDRDNPPWRRDDDDDWR